MALDEFDLIERFFTFSKKSLNAHSSSVLQGVGDDAAVIALPSTQNAERASKLLVATDTLIEAVHFPKQFPAEHIATRAMGVNLSDFAAMGVRPQWFTLALTMPEKDIAWLEAFSNGLRSVCDHYNIALVGGDTTRGSLSVTLTVMAQTQSNYLTRSGANIGDDIWVSGNLAKGAAALAVLEGRLSASKLSAEAADELLQAFNAPKPRIDLGVALADIASSAIDISDGLYADAAHIAKRSSVQCQIDVAALPIKPYLRQASDNKTCLQWALSGGDEYELLFTASPSKAEAIRQIAKSLAVPCHKVGCVQAGSGVQLVDVQHKLDKSVLKSLSEAQSGYQHF